MRFAKLAQAWAVEKNVPPDYVKSHLEEKVADFSISFCVYACGIVLRGDIVLAVDSTGGSGWFDRRGVYIISSHNSIPLKQDKLRRAVIGAVTFVRGREAVWLSSG